MKKWFWFILLILIIISIYGEFNSHHETSSHSIHSWSGIPMFYLIFGFFGCILLIVFAKILGHIFLARKEEYYDAQ